MDFAITGSDKFGKNEQIPTILLPEAFMADESVNMRERYGEYQAIRGRLLEMYDSESVAIQPPTDIFAITSIVSGTKTINVTGDPTGGATTPAAGDTIRINGSTTEANNITFTIATVADGVITTVEAITTQAASGNVFIGTTPVIKYHLHVSQSTQTEYLLVASAYHIFFWSYTDRSLTVKFTCATPASVEHWSIVTHLDDVYATNNVDMVQVWPVGTTPANSFGDLGTVGSGVDIDGANFVTKAKVLASFESYLFLYYVTYSTGTVYPLRAHHSDLSDPTGFDINGAGDAGLKNFNSTPDFLVGVGFWQNNIIVFKQERHIRGTLVTDDTVFTWDEEELKVGALSQDAIVNDRAGRLYWLASDLTIREIRTPVDVSALVDKTIKNLNTSVAEFAQMAFIDTFGTINLALATESSEENNKIISFSPDNANSFISDIPVRAFGKYTRQARFTYDTLPFAEYDDWGVSWLLYDSQVNVVGFPLVLVSNYAGNTYSMYQAEKDAGVDMTRSFVFNTSLGSIFPYKRVNNGMYGIFKRQGSGTVSVYIRNDEESGWRLLGTMSLEATDSRKFVTVHLPFDERFRNANFKFESADRMEIIGFLFRDFEVEDDR